MNFYEVSALVNVLTSSVLGALVFLGNPRNKINRLFSFFSAAVFLWSFGYFQWQATQEYAQALFWTHILMAGSIFITPSYFHFIATFLEAEKKKLVRALIVIGYSQALFFTVINWWSTLYIAGLRPKLGFPLWPDAGIFYTPFLVIWIFYSILPIILMLQYVRRKRGSESKQILIILLGTAIGYAGGITNYFLFYNIPVLPVGNISASIYLAFVAYAIMQYQFFNMKVLATELLTFSLWLFIFIRMVLSQSVQDELANAMLLGVSLLIGVLLIRSVDKEVEARELIEKQEKDLEAVNARQENLLHFISHEVKGYLSRSAAAFAAIMEGDYGPTTPELKGLSTAALAETRKGVETVMEILDAGDFKKGTVKFAREPFDFKAAVETAVADLRPSAAERPIKLNFEPPSEGTYTVVGDAAQMGKHVIRNLIDNAIRYTLQGTIDVALKRQGDKILFSVKDTGVGITPEDKVRLFTEGGRGAESIKVNVHSTGYGLYIAKSIVDAHGGRIWAESEGKDKGSTFFVELPAANTK